MVQVKLEKVVVAGPPSPSDHHSEGCGEYVKCGGSYYYYHVNRHIPKDKVVSLKWEGNYGGRVHGDLDFILVAWNGDSFTVVAYPSAGGVKKALGRFNGLTPSQAIQIAEDQEKARLGAIEAQPKCDLCGSNALILHEKQKKCECYTCCLIRIGEKVRKGKK